MHTHILIVGASSSIALETAREYARRGATLCITARSQAQLDTLQADLKVYGAMAVEGLVYDALVDSEKRDLVREAVRAIGKVDAILVAYGSLVTQEECNSNVEKTMAAFQLNAGSVIALCTRAAQYFESLPSTAVQPCLAVISSVAGDRGRQSNYVYGAAKGAVSLFLQGLRNRMYEKRIRVLTVKPGFVDTPMTAHLPKSPLFASARFVGSRIFKAMEGSNDVVYVPAFWRYIMFIIRHIPEGVFKKMKL